MGSSAYGSPKNPTTAFGFNANIFCNGSCFTQLPSLVTSYCGAQRITLGRLQKGPDLVAIAGCSYDSTIDEWSWDHTLGITDPYAYVTAEQVGSSLRHGGTGLQWCFYDGHGTTILRKMFVRVNYVYEGGGTYRLIGAAVWPYSPVEWSSWGINGAAGMDR